MKNHKGIILAAGQGTRMLNFKEPKSTLELKKNFTIMSNILSNFRKNYINEIFIITGFKSQVFKKYKAKKIINKNWKKTNMFKSLLCADKILNKFPCVVSYADIVYDYSAIKLLTKTKSEIAICYYSKWLTLWKKRFNNPLSDAEVFKLIGKNNLKEIGTKPKTLKEIEGQYMGLLYFTPKGWKKIKKILKKINIKKIDKVSMTEILNIVIKNGAKIRAVKYKNYFAEMDSPKDYKILKKDLKKVKFD
jgi:choline kinase